MKRFFLILVVLTTFVSGFAQTRTDSDGNTVYHPLFVVAQYQMQDFDFAKETSMYGLGICVSSISHWDRFHVGADVNFSLNAGIIDNWGCIIELGPSGRVDISKNFFVNMPVNAVCYVEFPEGSTDTNTTWGMKIEPSIHAFLTDRFGIFAGPQMTTDFKSGHDVSFGFQAGISYAF